MVKPFRRKGGGVGCHPPLEILTIAFLTFCLLLTDRPTLGVPEHKLKVVNICKMHGTGGLEVVVLCTFWLISMKSWNCKKKWWKSAITLSLGNVMTSEAQVRCKSMGATLLYQIYVFYCQFTMIFGQKWIKMLIVPSFSLTFDDVTVTLSFIVLSRIFFTNSSWYYLTSCQNLLRLNVTSMAKKIGQLLLNGGWLPSPSTLPFSNFSAKMAGPIWKIFFMGRCPKDEPKGKNLVCKKSSSHFWEKLEKPVEGWHPTSPPPPPPLGHGRVKAKCYSPNLASWATIINIAGISMIEVLNVNFTDVDSSMKSTNLSFPILIGIY